MVQCREGHQFCRDCLKRLLETALGDQKAVSQDRAPDTVNSPALTSPVLARSLYGRQWLQSPIQRP